MTERLQIWTVDHLLLCVPADPARDVALRALVLGAPTVDAVLDVLTRDGLATTPSFLCAAVEGDGVRVVIRGDLAAVAHGRDGSTLELDAGRAATWHDDVVTDIAGISLEVEGVRFEWLASPGAATVVAPRPSSPVVPEPVVEPLPAEDASALSSATLLPEDAVASPPAVDDPAPPPAAVAAPSDDPLDFSSLLDATRAPSPAAPPRPAAVAPPPPEPPTSGPPPVEPPPPAPVASPPAPSGVTPARHGVAPITAVPTSFARPDAPPPPPPPPPPLSEPAAASTGLGEHDGRTITLADLRRRQTEPATAPSAAAGAPAAVRQGEVRAVRCPNGHPNPPTAAACRSCGSTITDPTVVVVPRPVVARLVFESGLVVDVDRPQLIGRRPTTPPESAEIPNLVTVPSPEGDISRAHTAVRLDGWDVLVEDVGSTNGTEVQLPGQPAVRLREHDPVLVVTGTLVSLAGTVRFRLDAPET